MNNYKIYNKIREILVHLAVVYYASTLCTEDVIVRHENPLQFAVILLLLMLSMPHLVAMVVVLFIQNKEKLSSMFRSLVEE